MKIVIGSRASELAIRQSEWVRDRILTAYPNYEIEIVKMTSEGDRRADQSLALIGGKGLFTRELEAALREGRIDLAVHSLKDLPYPIAEDLPILAYTQRENAMDAWILPDNPRKIKRIGTSSPRRMVQLKQLYPAMEFVPLRGNVQTRLEKLNRGECDATVLAAAGLVRLGILSRANRIFSANEMIPAAGQGILAVQGRSEGEYGYLSVLNDRHSQDAYAAEAAFIQEMGAGCTAAVGAYAQIQSPKQLRLYTMVADDKMKVHFACMGGKREDGAKIGRILAQNFLSRVKLAEFYKE